MRIGLLFASLCLMSTNLHAKPQRVTIFADDAYPPYSYAENGRAVGIYPEILRAADVLMTEFYNPSLGDVGSSYSKQEEFLLCFPPIIIRSADLTFILTQTLS